MAERKDRYKSSFGVIRANPRISGNLKISIDSSKNIWLNSIDSNAEMSKNQYKGYKTSGDGEFCLDVYNLFNSGKTPTNFIFGVKGEDSINENYISSLADQYDGFYSMGVTPLISDLYPEDFSYLAPLYLGRSIPKYFVIFRVDDPIDFSYVIEVTSLEIGKTYKIIEDLSIDTTASGYKKFTIESDGIDYSAGTIFTATTSTFSTLQGIGKVTLLDANYNLDRVRSINEEFVNNILPKSSIVATYSLQEGTNIGDYLRKIQSNNSYTRSLIDVRFEDQALSTYNGVSVKDGVYCRKGEYLSSAFTTDSTIIEFDQLMTDGFKRNDVLSYNLLNLEFLFNDSEADLYTINRYYGLYVDDIQTGKFKLSGSDFYQESTNKGNFPEPKNSFQISERMLSSFYQNNDSGVRIFMDPNSKWGYIPSSDDLHDEEKLKLFYVKDREENLYSYKKQKNYSASLDSNKWGKNTSQEDIIILRNKLVDFSKFSGPDVKKRKEFKAELTQAGGNSYSVIRIGDQLLPGDSIILYHPFGENSLGNKRYDYFVASALDYLIPGWGPGSSTNDDGAYYFHPFGTKQEIAKAIAGVLNGVKYKSYKAFAINDEVVIRTYSKNAKTDLTYSLFVYRDFYNKTPFTLSNKLFFNEIDGSDLRSDLNFIGGSKYTNTRIKIKKEDSNKIIAEKSYVRTNSGLSKVKFVGKCVDENDSELRYNTIKDYSTHSIVEIEDQTHTILLGTSKTIIVDELIDVETGVLSMYPVKDLDVDFWSSTYGKTPTEEYYRYIDVQPDGITPIQEGMHYAVASGAIINYMGSSYGPNSNFIFKGGSSSRYTLVQTSSTARANVVPLPFVNSVQDAIASGKNDPLVDIDKFPGFIGLQDIKFLNDIAGIQTRKEEMYFGKVENEYEVLKENYLTNLVTLSRVTPYITKWVYEGGVDVRGNDYRLNCSPAFTPLNFSPSFFSPGRDPLYFTNEWYLMESPPISATPGLLKNSSNYCTGSISISDLQDADPGRSDYFLNYFTVDGNDFYDLDPVRFSDLKNKPVEERYTYFEYNPASEFSETLFRGVKVKIKERTDASLETKEKDKFKNADKKFDGYKFSCILKSTDDPDPYSVTSPVTFKVIENETFKTVTLLITVINNDLRFADFKKLTDKLYSSTGEANVEFSNSTSSWYYNPTGIYGNSDYFGLYSLNSKYRPLIVNGGAHPTDYQRLVNGNGVISNKISNVKLSAGLNVSSRSTIGITPYVGGNSLNGSGIVPIAVNPEYDTDLRNEVKFYPSELPVSGPGSRSASFLAKYTLFSPKEGETSLNYLYRTPWIVGAGKNYLNFNQINYPDYTFDFVNLGFGLPTFSNVPVPANYDRVKDKAVYQFDSGDDYWGSVFDKLTFPEIYRIFSSDDSYINYIKSYWDASLNQTVIVNGTYTLEFMKPSTFVQSERKIPLEDANKPDAYNNSVIGYELIEESDVSEFFRYSGGYAPKFKDVLFFDNLKEEYITDDKNPTGTPLDIVISLNKKLKNESSYFGIGSEYEISVYGNPRKRLRLVRGKTYNFVFENFFTEAYTGNTTLKKNFIISSVENSGLTANKYSKGFTYKTGFNGATFTVPLDAPEYLYYEIENEDYAGGIALVAEEMEFKNVTFGVTKDSFGLIKNVNYYKYTKGSPSRIDPNSGFKMKYPLIGETPIDKRDVYVYESTWDPGRYREYLGPTTYQELPGTRSMLEQKSFMGSKVMKTPATIKHPQQVKYPSSIGDVFNVNPDLYPNYEILWEETETEIKAYLLVGRTIVKHFRDGGIDLKFAEILVPEFGVNNDSNLIADTNAYMNLNVLPQYEVKDLGVYIKKSEILPNSVVETIVTNLNDFDKISKGYAKSTNNNITKKNSLEFQFRLKKDPGYNYSVAFSFLVGKI